MISRRVFVLFSALSFVACARAPTQVQVARQALPLQAPDSWQRFTIAQRLLYWTNADALFAVTILRPITSDQVTTWHAKPAKGETLLSSTLETHCGTRVATRVFVDRSQRSWEIYYAGFGSTFRAHYHHKATTKDDPSLLGLLKHSCPQDFPFLVPPKHWISDGETTQTNWEVARKIGDNVALSGSGVSVPLATASASQSLSEWFHIRQLRAKLNSAKTTLLCGTSAFVFSGTARAHNGHVFRMIAVVTQAERRRYLAIFTRATELPIDSGITSGLNTLCAKYKIPLEWQATHVVPSVHPD
jgi:hypothetical protein